MRLRMLGSGERISAASAAVLFVLMFFEWFTVKAVNTSNLLFAIASVEPGKNAWQALDYMPYVFTVAIIASFCVAAARVTGATPKAAFWANAAITVLGLVSVALILYRIVNPPVFDTEPTITYEGAVQLPVFLSLGAALGIAIGGVLAMSAGLRPGRPVRGWTASAG